MAPRLLLHAVRRLLLPVALRVTLPLPVPARFVPHDDTIAVTPAAGHNRTKSVLATSSRAPGEVEVYRRTPRQLTIFDALSVFHPPGVFASVSQTSVDRRFSRGASSWSFSAAKAREARTDTAAHHRLTFTSCQLPPGTIRTKNDGARLLRPGQGSLSPLR